MNEKIQIIAGEFPQQFKHRYESTGHILLADGREVPAVHVEEESCSEDDPNRSDLRHSRGPVLVVAAGTTGLPVTGETFRFRHAEPAPDPNWSGPWYSTYEVE